MNQLSTIDFVNPPLLMPAALEAGGIGPQEPPHVYQSGVKQTCFNDKGCAPHAPGIYAY